MKSCKQKTGQSQQRYEMMSSYPDNMNITKRARSGLQEIFITASVRPGQMLADLYRQAAQWLATQQAAIVHADLFGRPDDTLVLGAAELAHLPATYLTNSEGNLAGLHIWAVQGAEVRTLHYRDQVIGRFFEDADCRYCRLGGVLPHDFTADPAEQTGQVFEALQAGLHQVDMDYSHVIRTWFYNDRITDWYDSFNQVRTDLYQQLGTFKGLVPASTGIGSRNARDYMLVAGLFAVVPKHDRVSQVMVASPLQGEAWDYGSSFSRAVELATPAHKYLTISGTASIAPEGHTLHLNDAGKQTELTLQVVDKILASRDFAWADVTRAYAYFKHAHDAHHLDRCLQALEIPRFPYLVVKNDVCRDDLLFELELDAVRS
ncbi:hypothetical protein ACFL6U_22725 [Planctomycetota bacterium]